MDPLAQLKDIQIPIAPGWWPPAPGWWVLGILILLGIAYLYRHLLSRHFRHQPFKQARDIILDHNTAYIQHNITSNEYVELLNQLLKRAAIHSDRASHVAPLSGKGWLTYLDDISCSTEFTQGPGQALGDQRYQTHSQADLTDLHTSVIAVIRRMEKSA